MITDIFDPSKTHLEAETDKSINDFLGYALRRTQMKVFEHFTANMSQYDIRPAQFCTLYEIGEQPGITQSELAKTLDIDAPRIVNLVHKLEERGLAVRVRCKQDKRSHGLFLTKQGEKLVKEVKPLADESDRQATSNLSEQEREQLLRLLHKILF